MIEQDFELDPRDLEPFTYPAAQGAASVGYRSVCLGSYIPWDVKKQSEIIQRELGWRATQVEGVPRGNTPTRRSSATCRACATTSSSSSAATRRVTPDDRARPAQRPHDEGATPISSIESSKASGRRRSISSSTTSDITRRGVQRHRAQDRGARRISPDFDDIRRGQKTWDFDRWYRRAPLKDSGSDRHRRPRHGQSCAPSSKAVDSARIRSDRSSMRPDELDDCHAPDPARGRLVSRRAMARIDARGLRRADSRLRGCGTPGARDLPRHAASLAPSGTEGGPRGPRPGSGQRSTRSTRAASARVPHVGWNYGELRRSPPGVPRTSRRRDFYFVHSYHFQLRERGGRARRHRTTAATSCGIVGGGNVLGFQFHPEKSQANGLRLLENFCDWDGKC